MGFVRRGNHPGAKTKHVIGSVDDAELPWSDALHIFVSFDHVSTVSKLTHRAVSEMRRVSVFERYLH